MNKETKAKLEDSVEIIDITTEKDDPYMSFDVEPSDKFMEELLNNGYSMEEIYDYQIDKEKGILIDYNLLPQEILKWDKIKKVMTLKMKYPSFYEFKRALIDLGIIYDEEYWDKYYYKQM
ncbi:MAG: hypothetical protein IJJ47_13085 [Methanosphaera sp.]|nr:hypothetical protein [Methanosphaera sp.]